MVQKIKNFLTTDIWRIRRRNISGLKSFWINHLRVILLALRGFGEDKCQLRASALTFFSLLSVVPVVAMAFGIAKGFGFEQLLEEQIRNSIQGQEEVLSKVIGFATALLENTKGGVVAGVGVALLFWSVIKVLGNIEQSFNDIWGIKTGRTLIRKFSDYLSIMLICPVLLIASSSITVFITSQVTLVAEKLSFLGPVSSLIMFLIGFLPYCVLWVLFSFIYIIMPNTKVTLGAGVFAGILAGTLYQVVQWFYINFQIGVSKAGAIYGSFAALPLFLVWLQVSWLVVLLGAEISFAYQNVDTYEFEPDCLKVSRRFKRLISLRVVQLLVKRFTKEEKPLTAEAISHELEIPIRLLHEVLFDLTGAGVLAEVRYEGDSRISAYQPSRDSSVLTIKYVLEALDNKGTDSLPIQDTRELQELRGSLDSFATAIEKSPSNHLLKNL